MENPYYEYFKDVKGLGNDKFYTGIGHVYKSRGGIQRGYGFFVPGIPSGRKRGLGMGTILKSIFSSVTPLIKKFAPHVLRTVGTTAADTIANIAKDSILGNNLKESAVKHGKTAFNQLRTQLPETFSGVLHQQQYKNGTLPEDENSFDIEYEEESPQIYQPKRRKSTRFHTIPQRKNLRKRLNKQYPGLRHFD